MAAKTVVKKQSLGRRLLEGVFVGLGMAVGFALVQIALFAGVMTAVKSGVLTGM